MWKVKIVFAVLAVLTIDSCKGKAIKQNASPSIGKQPTVSTPLAENDEIMEEGMDSPFEDFFDYETVANERDRRSNDKRQFMMPMPMNQPGGVGGAPQQTQPRWFFTGKMKPMFVM